MLTQLGRYITHYALCCLSLCVLTIAFYHSPVVIASTPMPSPSATEDWAKNGLIAFQMYRPQGVNLYTVDMKGIEKSLVTGNLLLDTMPVWSPNGKQLAFGSVFRESDDPIGQIYVINADGTNLRRLTKIGGFSPSWSPDGLQLAFASNDGVYIINEYGQNLHRVAPGPMFSGRTVQWSPDGKYIAFISGSTTTDQMEIHLLDMRTNLIRVVTNNLATIDSIVWSPDSQSIAFSSNGNTSPKSDIYVTSLTNHNQRRLAEIDSYSTTPVWSPDGNSIAFEMDDGVKTDIYIMDANGENIRKLVSGQSPAWSPDGAFIVFVSFQDDGDGFSGISIIGRNGSNLHHLVAHSAGDAPADLTWQP